MDRRRFCKIAALALGATGLSRLPAIASEGGGVTLPGGAMPAACRVKVIRRECYEELQSLYLDDPETGRCRSYEPGQTFQFDVGDTRPRDFCPRAWDTIRSSVEIASHCPSSANDDMQRMVVSCPDGTRPVLFGIELL